MDWNAVVVSVWLAFCAVSSGYCVRPRDCVRDWLREDCGVRTTFIRAELSSRRSLLGALVYLNPDTRDGRTGWIDPILARCEERAEWEEALLGVVEKGSPDHSEARGKYWWKFITEGVSVGQAIERVITEHRVRRGTGLSGSAVGSQPISFTTGVHKV